MPYNALTEAGAAAAPITTLGDPVLGNGMTLEDFIRELRPLLQGRTDIEEARYTLYFNLAYVDTVTSLKIEELQGSLNITLVEGQPLYLLPNSLQAIQYVSLHDPDLTDQSDKGKPLIKTDLSLYRSREHKDGRPREFFRYGKILVLWPQPDEDAGVVSVDFRIRPRFLTLPTHCPILPVEWHEALLWNARYKLLESLQEWEAAAVAENTYIKAVRKRLDTAAIEDDTRIVRSSSPNVEFRLRRTRRRQYGVE